MQRFELLVLQILRWDLSYVTPYGILDILLRGLEDCDAGVSLSLIRRHAETFISLVATEYTMQLSASPNLIAVSSLLAAFNGMRPHLRNQYVMDKLLAALAGLSGLDAADIVHFMGQIESRMAERLPTTISGGNEDAKPVPTAAAAKQQQQQQLNPSKGTNPSPPSASPTDLMELSAAMCS